MDRIHLVASTNCPPNRTPDRDQSLRPLNTLIHHLSCDHLMLDRLVLVGSNHPNDGTYYQYVLEQCPGIKTELQPCFKDSPIAIAKIVSKTAEIASQEAAETWVDLTPGPKDRSAVLFAAGSIVPGVQVVYIDQEEGQFVVRKVPTLGKLNSWLGRHGVHLRNYRESVLELGAIWDERNGTDNREMLSEGVCSVLNSTNPLLPNILATLSEWVAKKAVPIELFGIQDTEIQKWKGNGADSLIQKNQDEWTNSAGRASQLLYLLRCFFSHPPRSSGRNWSREDVLALLDMLSFLSSRMKDSSGKQSDSTVVISNKVGQKNFIFLAADGDDVGRQFESLISVCDNSAESLHRLLNWSSNVHGDLQDAIDCLIESFSAQILMITGDGFLAKIDVDHLEGIKQTFRPHLAYTTMTTGVGPTPKDAFLALKLGKARHRGGGYFLSLETHQEMVLWHPAPEERKALSFPIPGSP